MKYVRSQPKPVTFSIQFPAHPWNELEQLAGWLVAGALVLLTASAIGRALDAA